MADINYMEVPMEIERKYLISNPPAGYDSYPCHRIEQAYLCTEPVVRIRQEDEDYYLTYKSKGLMIREEYNLPLTQEAYNHLLTKADGNILTKTRYLLPLDGTGRTIELDIFDGKFVGLMLAEVEFDNEKDAMEFMAPDWFGEDVTYSGDYQNSRLSRLD